MPMRSPRIVVRAALLVSATVAAFAPGCDRGASKGKGDAPGDQAAARPGPRDDGDDDEDGEGRGSPAAEEPSASANQGEPSPTPDPPLHRAQHRAMGTVFVVTVVAPPQDPTVRRAVAAAFEEIDRLEGLLSEWRPHSEISRINEAAGEDTAVPVSPAVARVIQAGLEASRRSDGAFDLSWAALHGLYRFPPNPIRLPTPEELAERLPLIDHTSVRFAEDADPPTVRLAKPGMAIGTGGIAKGHALDRAGAILRDAGFEQFMLFGGGQVQVHGRKGDRPWRVGIQHPRRPQDYFAFLEAEEGSISTSGDYEHVYVDDDGRRWHHLIDPRTGEPATGATSVTLLAPKGVQADALSTACFILGPARCLRMLADHPDEPEAVIVDRELRLHVTPGTRERLRFVMPLADDGRLPPGAE